MPRVSEAHKVARREQIVDAAIQCFYRNGFHPTTMDDIVRESGLSAGAVYTYFTSKDELIAAAGAHKLGELRAEIDRLVALDPAPTPAEVVRSLIERVVEITTATGVDLTRIIVNGWGETPRNTALRELVQGGYAYALAALSGLIARWRESGQVGARVDSDAAAALLSLVLGFIVQRAVVGPVEPEAYVRGAVALLEGPIPRPVAGLDGS